MANRTPLGTSLRNELLELVPADEENVDLLPSDYYDVGRLPPEPCVLCIKSNE